MWTSTANDSYMGVKCHLTDNNFTTKHQCLAIKPAPGSHTADYIATFLKDALQDWNLLNNDRQQQIVTENGANVRKGVRLLENVMWSNAAMGSDY
jgi:hypothetical protein